MVAPVLVTPKATGVESKWFPVSSPFLHRRYDSVKAKKAKGTNLTETIRQLVADRHLRRPAVEDLTGLSRSTIYDLMSKDAFPRPVKLTGKAVAWPESKINAWLAQRAAG